MVNYLGVCSPRYVRSAVTIPYWDMESLISHGKVLGSLLSTLCTESVSVGVVVRREVSSLRLAEPYIGLSWPRLSSFPPFCPQFHPLVCLDPPSMINMFSDEGLSSRTWGCQDCRLLSLFVCVSYQQFINLPYLPFSCKNSDWCAVFLDGQWVPD